MAEAKLQVLNLGKMEKAERRGIYGKSESVDFP
jgi:hypothetical protein